MSFFESKEDPDTVECFRGSSPPCRSWSRDNCLDAVTAAAQSSSFLNLQLFYFISYILKRPSSFYCHPQSKKDVDDNGIRNAKLLPSHSSQSLLRKTTRDNPPIPSVQLHIRHKGDATGGRPLGPSPSEASRGTLREVWHETDM